MKGTHTMYKKKVGQPKDWTREEIQIWMKLLANTSFAGSGSV